MKLVTKKVVVEILKVYPNKWNPNIQSDIIYKKMKEVMEKKGFYGSIIVREVKGKYEILDGEHRWRCAVDLKFEKIPVETVGKISDKEAQFWTIFFNNTRGKDDVIKRAELIKMMEAGQAQLLPWTEDELENLKKLVDFDFSQFKDRGKTEIEKEDKRVIQLIVSEKDGKAWDKALEEGKKRKWDENKLFRVLITEFLSMVLDK